MFHSHSGFSFSQLSLDKNFNTGIFFVSFTQWIFILTTQSFDCSVILRTFLQAGTGVRYTPATQIIYSVQEKRLTMFIKMEKEGCYQATVSYGDVKLKNGEFNIIVLSSKLIKVLSQNEKSQNDILMETS